MKCVVRVRKTEIGIPEVFLPKGMSAEDLMKELYEREVNILSADDELDDEMTSFDSSMALVQTINDNYTEFYIKTMIEVNR